MNIENIFILNAEDKFWGLTSVLVPSLEKFNQSIKANLKPIKEVLTESELEGFEVYWFEQNVTGELKLPGEWNYCKIGDNYYHLVKTKSDGRFAPDGKEYFFYSIVYDDWASSFLTNKVMVTGTISKTGDREKVEQNLIQTIPMVTDLNDRLDFDSHTEIDVNLWEFKKPLDDFYKKNTFTQIHPLALNWFNMKLDSMRNRWNEIYTDEKLIFPIYIQESDMGNWKIGVINNLIDYIYKGLAIFDVDKTKIHWSNFIAMYPSELVVTLSNVDMEVKQISKTVNVSRWIKEINLEGLTDIQELKADFTEVEEENTIKDLAQKIVKRHLTDKLTNTQVLTMILDVYKDLIKYASEMGDRLFISTGKYWPNFNGILNTEQRRELGIFENVEVKYDPPGEWVVNGKTTNIREMQWSLTVGPFELSAPSTVKHNEIIQRNRIFSNLWGYFYTLREGVDLNKKIFYEIDTGTYTDSCTFGDTQFDENKLSITVKPLHLQDVLFNSHDNTIGKEFWQKFNITNIIGIEDYITYNAIWGGVTDYEKKLNFKKENIKFFPIGLFKPFTNYQGHWNNATFSTIKLTAFLHLAVMKLKNKGVEIIDNPKDGIVLIPDHDNHGFVPGILKNQKINVENFQRDNWVLPPQFNFSTKINIGCNEGNEQINIQTDPSKVTDDIIKFNNSNLFKNPHLTDIENKTRLKVTELLTGINEENWDMNKPSETILTDKRWDKIPTAIKEGWMVKTLIKHQSWDIGFKFYNQYIPGTSRYPKKKEFPYIVKYKLAKLDGFWDWIITLPANLTIDVQELLMEFSDLPSSCFAWHNTKTGDSSLTWKNDDDDVLSYEGSYRGYVKYKKLNEIPEKNRKNLIRIYIDPEGRKSFSEHQHNRLKELCERIYNLFFKEEWNPNINYKSKTVFGDIYGKYSSKKNLHWFNLTYFRPYNDFWFVSQISIKQEPGKGKTSSGEINTDLIIDGAKLPTDQKIAFKYWKDGEGEIVWTLTSENKWRWNIDEKTEENIKCLVVWNGEETDWDAGVSNSAPNGFYAAQNVYKNFYDLPKLTMRTLKKESLKVKKLINLNPSSFDLIFDSFHPFNKNEISELNWQKDSNFAIPLFLWKYLDPSQPVSAFHAINFGNITDYNEIRNIIKEKIKKAFRDIHVNISNDPIYFDLKGTDFILCAKYSVVRKWLFEILVKNPHNVLKEAGGKKVVFDNNIADTDEKSLVKVINSSNELNIYGHKIPIKDRFKLDGNNIDLNVHVEHLEDKFQSASHWYYVKINSPHSNILTQIEVPKEAAIAANMSVMDKRQLHQSFIYNSAERFYEKANYQFEKDKYFSEINMEQKYADIRKSHGLFGVISRGFKSLVGVAQTALMGKAMMNKPGMIAGAVGGAVDAVSNIASDVWGYATGWSEDQEKRQFRREVGIQLFALRDEALMEKHAEAERLDRLVIHNATSANTYPSSNNALIYRSFNQALGRTNVYLTQYRPQGELLEILNNYYEEYGFDILLPNERITGIENIKKHIKFLTITSNQNPNSTIRTMIETRLMAGVKVIDV